MFFKVMPWVSTLMLVAAIALNMTGQDATFVMLCAIYSAVVMLWPRAALEGKK